jgi:hypothetical protein
MSVTLTLSPGKRDEVTPVGMLKMSWRGASAHHAH